MFGVHDPDRLVRAMPRRLFHEWMAFYSLCPWDGERDDLNAGLICATLANVHRDSASRSKPYTAGELALDFLTPPETREDVQKKLNAGAMELIAGIRAMRSDQDKPPATGKDRERRAMRPPKRKK